MNRNTVTVMVATGLAYLAGDYFRSRRFTRDVTDPNGKIQKKISELAETTWSTAFHSGYQSAVDDPTVRYQHYEEFKDILEKSPST